MTDLKFEQKRSLSRAEAADQLTALADALREGGDVELEFGRGTLSLRMPDDLRSEIEVEIEDGKIELEIEFSWPLKTKRAMSTPRAETATPQQKSANSKTGRAGTGTAKKGVKRPAAKTS